MEALHQVPSRETSSREAANTTCRNTTRVRNEVQWGILCLYSTVHRASSNQRRIDYLQDHHRQTYKMLQTDSKGHSLVPTTSTWNCIKHQIEILRPLNDFIVAPQDSNLVLSDVIFQYRLLKYKLSLLQDNAYRDTLHDSLNMRFEEIEEPGSLFRICEALDPRCDTKTIPSKTWELIKSQAANLKASSASHPKIPEEAEVQVLLDKYTDVMRGSSTPAVQQETISVQNEADLKILTYRSSHPQYTIDQDPRGYWVIATS
jgi:hypothetical protein